MDYYDIFGNNSVFVGDHERNPPNQFVSKNDTLIPMVFYTYISWSSTLICQGTSLVVPGHTNFTSFTSSDFFQTNSGQHIKLPNKRYPLVPNQKKGLKKHVQFLQESLITAVQSINLVLWVTRTLWLSTYSRHPHGSSGYRSHASALSWRGWRVFPDFFGTLRYVEQGV